MEVISRGVLARKGDVDEDVVVEFYVEEKDGQILVHSIPHMAKRLRKTPFERYSYIVALTPISALIKW